MGASDDEKEIRPLKGKLEGKIAVITGAGNGIGYTMTKTFVSEGARVIAADIRMDDLAKWEGFAGVDSVASDISKAEDVNRLIGVAEEKHGRLDILCNVAGINDLCTPLDDTTDELWDRVLAICLTGPFLTSRRAVQSMLKSGGGVILNIASYAAFNGSHGASYTAAKHGLVGLTKHVTAHYCDKGIRCVAICPGGVKTDIEKHSGGTYHKRGWQVLVNSVGSMPVRYAKTEDIAQTAVFLVSDAAKHINGAIVPVDAGMSAF
jgi:NAD(P)-dependent dehydrogenase (short-subunit alcohol dehydrogenase family)